MSDTGNNDKNPSSKEEINPSAQSAEGASSTDITERGVSSEADFSESQSEKGADEESAAEDVPDDIALEKLAAPKKSPKTILLVSVVLILVLAGALAASAYFAWQTQQSIEDRLQALQGQIAERDQRIQKTESQLAEFVSQTQSISKTLKEQQQQFGKFDQQAADVQSLLNKQSTDQRERLKQMDARLNGQQQRLLTLSTTNREDWLLAEAEYLLRLASQRILIERAPQNAIALLETADGIVQQVANGLGDPELFAIRKSLAREIAELKLVAGVDKEGIYLSLQSYADEIDRLPRIPPSTFNSGEFESVPDDPDPDAEPQTWYQKAWSGLGDMLGVFDAYIRYREDDLKVEPLASTEHLRTATLNIRLLLQQAQLAMLREDLVIYQNSLQKAQELVAEAFYSSPEALAYQQALKELSSKNIAPTLPDISESLKLLHGYIQTIHTAGPVSEGGVEP